jgi:capsular polysaccharide biosynthesis protein/Mrp family chromosome partitioning ATPase
VETSDALLRSLRRRWYLVVLAALVAGTTAFLVVDTLPTEHRATTRLLVGPPTDAPVDTLRSAGLVAHTYGELGRSRTTMAGAANDAGLDLDLDELRERLDVSANETTRVVTITVTDTDPAAADALAAALADRLLDAAPPATPVIDPSQPDAIPRLPAGVLTVIDDTSLPADELERPIVLLVALATVIGAAVGGTVAVVLELAPWRQAPPSLARLAHQRVLGRLDISRPGLLPWRRRAHRRRAAEQLQLLVTKLQHLRGRRPLESIAIVGGTGTEGNAAVAVGVARTFAAQGRQVALVDLTDERLLARHLGAGDGHRDVHTVGDTILELEDVEGDGDVRLLVSDTVRATPSNGAARHLVDQLGDVVDLVVVVASPVLLEFGTLLVAERTSAAVVVTVDDEQRIDGAIEALEVLERHGATVFGTVLACRDRSKADPAFRGSTTGGSSSTAVATVDDTARRAIR